MIDRRRWADRVVVVTTVATLAATATLTGCRSSSEPLTRAAEPAATAAPPTATPPIPDTAPVDDRYVEALCTAVDRLAGTIDDIDEDLSGVALGEITVPAPRMDEIRAEVLPRFRDFLIALGQLPVPAHLQEWHKAIVQRAERLALSLSEGDLAAVGAYVSDPLPEAFPAINERLMRVAADIPSCANVSARLTH